jgi:hypothetical protein
MALNFHKTRTASKLNKQHLDLAIKAYSRVWRLMLPALGINKRLKDGFSHRMLSSALPAADLWIQAASAGEAYLAWSLVENLKLPYPCRILATTNTRQGMEILEKAKEKLSKDDGKHTLMCKWFPFDQPEIMDMAVKQISPDLVVLLERTDDPKKFFTLLVYKKFFTSAASRRCAGHIKTRCRQVCCLVWQGYCKTDAQHKV